MPKQQQSIRDFSGGIADGINPKELKENQLVSCNNLIPDGVGRLTSVPGNREASAVAVSSRLPSGNHKNIHGWSSDMAFEYSNQESGNNISAPTIEVVQAAKKASIDFWHSTQWNPAFPSHVNKEFTVHNTDRDYPIFSWSINTKAYTNTSEGADSDINPLVAYTTLWAKGRTVKNLETLANDHPASFNSDGNEIPWAWKTVTSSNKISHSPAEMTTSAEVSNDGLSSTSVGASLNSNRFIVEKVSDNNVWGSNSISHPVWKMTLEFEYWGVVNYELQGNWAETADRASDPGAFNYGFRPSFGTIEVHGTSYPVANFNNNSAGTQNFNAEKGVSLAVTNSMSQYTDSYGAFSKLSFNIDNISYYTSSTYTITIEVYKVANQSSFDTITLAYTNNYGETADDVVNGLFGGGINYIDNSSYNSDNRIFWEKHDSGVHFFQSSETNKPFGIKQATIAVSNVTTASSTLTDGERYQHLVAVASNNSQASIYSMETDNWLPWSLDLRIDKTVTTNHESISFFDTEGYLSASCMAFRGNNIPKWFGYLNLNKTYCKTNMSNATDFFTDDFSPTPHEAIVSTGLSANQNSSNNSLGAIHTYSHQAVDWYKAEAVWGTVTGWLKGDSMSFKNIDTTDNKTRVKVLRHTKTYIAPESFGIRAFVHFFDTNLKYNTTTNADAPMTKMDGTFNINERIVLYYSYVYEGGAISKPKAFDGGVISNSTALSGQAVLSPNVDQCAMGVNIVIGKQLIGGDGSNNVINPRLKGVEIWAKYRFTDPANIYLLCEINLNKGYKSSLSGEWKPLSNYNFGSSSIQAGYSTGDFTATAEKYKSDYLIFTEPNQIFSYKNKYGLNHEDVVGFNQGGTGWKTACIFNRRAYYGNIRIEGKEGIIEYKPDAILKSQAGMYGAVGISNMIEATINDGDEIVALKVVGNKLCQFKKYSLTVMGIKVLEDGNSNEIIEAVIHHAGVYNDNQITQTPYGLFWVSRSGIYLYDGQKITKLNESSTSSSMSKANWETFYGEKTFCGYDAYWNHVLIPRTNLNNNTSFIYSFNTKAFTTSNISLTGLKTSGFIQTRSGHVMYAQEIAESSDSIDKSDSNSAEYQAGSSNDIPVQPA